MILSKSNVAIRMDEDKDADAWLAACVRRARIVGPYTEVFDLTPARARAIAAINGNDNRNLLASRVREYANAISNGWWELNGETIIISDTVRLNDGQHRVYGVIEANTSIRVMIAFGVSRDSRKTVDTGAKRTSGHVLGMDGVEDATIVSAAVKFIVNYERRLALSTHQPSKVIEDRYKQDRAISDSIKHGRKVGKKLAGNPSMWTALHYLMRQVNEKRAEEFFAALETGANMAVGHPALLLQERLLADAKSRAKLLMAEIAALAIKAMSAYCEGKPIKVLRWLRGAEVSEQFPRFRT